MKLKKSAAMAAKTSALFRSIRDSLDERIPTEERITDMSPDDKERMRKSIVLDAIAGMMDAAQQSCCERSGLEATDSSRPWLYALLRSQDDPLSDRRTLCQYCEWDLQYAECGILPCFYGCPLSYMGAPFTPQVIAGILEDIEFGRVPSLPGIEDLFSDSKTGSEE